MVYLINNYLEPSVIKLCSGDQIQAGVFLWFKSEFKRLIRCHNMQEQSLFLIYVNFRSWIDWFNNIS